MVVITYSTFPVNWYHKLHKETVDKTCFYLSCGNKEQSCESAKVRDSEVGPCMAPTGFSRVASPFQIKADKVFPEH